MKKARKAQDRQQEPTGTAPADASLQTRGTGFPIVGIGASAGGLEALELFLGNVPANSGMAFVIVQHLDPTRKGIMAELLQRGTSMPVIQVTDRTKVEPDHVYVIPPNADMSILHGTLHLLEPAAPRGLRLPIDFFFRSLADDQRDRGVGVVLSGMGSDGTLGLRAIKEKAGAVFVQATASAKFEGMPQSAIDAGLADVVAPAEELPARISSYLQRAPLATSPEAPLDDRTQSGLEKVLILIRTQTGNDLSSYKKTTIYRRIERRMHIHQITMIGNYVRFMRENPQETDLLFKECLIGVTSFFRDPAAWEKLKEEALPSLLQPRPNGPTLRAWVPGCSTGEEAYSLAMAFVEALEKANPPSRFSLQIFGTDLDKDAIDKARQGVYPANIASDVTPERLARFFIEDERGYRVTKQIREMVIFAPHNVIADPPFSKLDILVCRNLLIYLNAELQARLLPVFHFSLNPGGILFLGSAETAGTHADLFNPVDGKARIYRRLEDSLRAEPLEVPAAFARPQQVPSAASAPRSQSKAPANLQSLADQLLLQSYSPAAVLVTDQGDILYISGRTGRFLEPPAGKANWNIFAMARDGLKYELSDAFHQALRRKESVTVRGVKVATDGGAQAVDITVHPLTEPAALRGMVMVILASVTTPPEPKRRGKPARVAATDGRQGMIELDLQRVREELQHAREELHSTREEMQTSQEELKSTNEELQSTNEELQSTNEELLTSKEEMQSMNEELQTVNAELQSRVEDLSIVNDDMRNLLDSTDIAILFLDSDLHVRRFTAQMAQIINLISGDVGRPITDITSALVYPELNEDARGVLRTLASLEKEVATQDGRWYRVRTLPYRTMAKKIDGVVVTFMDITVSKTLEAALREAQAALEAQLTGRTAELGRARQDLRTEIDHNRPAPNAGGEAPQSSDAPEDAP